MTEALRTPAILVAIIVAGKADHRSMSRLTAVGSSSLVPLSVVRCCAATSQNIVFNTIPVSQTVEEGGDATFACSGTVDGTAQPTRYRIRSGATVLQSVGGNISDLDRVSGIDAALVFGDFNSQLLLRDVTREASGHTVSCAILVSSWCCLDAMNAPPAHITVTCKYGINFLQSLVL